MLLQIASTDSIFVKIQALESQIKELSESSSPNLLPLYTAILGAVFVWFGQYVDRESKKSQELINGMNSIFAKCQQLHISLENVSRGLAFEKNMANFWYYSHLTEYNFMNNETERSKQYYNKCLISTDSANVYVVKIGETLSEYYSLVSKFALLSKKEINISSILEMQRNSRFEDVPEISTSLQAEEAYTTFNANYENLVLIYQNKFAQLESINNTIKSICKEFKNTSE